MDTPLNEGLGNSRGMLPEFVGVAEVLFDSEADLMEAMNTREGQKLSDALLEDEGKFIDHSQSSAFIVKEHEFTAD